MNDKYWMKQAFEQALQAQKEGEVPVGAVLVSQDNQVLGIGQNCVQKNHDPSAHAEVIAIKQAGQKLQNHRLLNTTLYVTLEPCSMCAGLIVHARIKRLVFATRDFKSGAAGSVYNLLSGSPLNHKVNIDEGIMELESSLLMTQFFRVRR